MLRYAWELGSSRGTKVTGDGVLLVGLIVPVVKIGHNGVEMLEYELLYVTGPL